MISVLIGPDPEPGKPKPQPPRSALPPDPTDEFRKRYERAVYSPEARGWGNFIVAHMLDHRGEALQIMTLLNDLGRRSGIRPRSSLRSAKRDMLKGIYHLRQAGILVPKRGDRLRLHEGVAEMLVPKFGVAPEPARAEKPACGGGTGAGIKRTRLDPASTGFVEF